MNFASPFPFSDEIDASIGTTESCFINGVAMPAIHFNYIALKVLP